MPRKFNFYFLLSSTYAIEILRRVKLKIFFSLFFTIDILI